MALINVRKLCSLRLQCKSLVHAYVATLIVVVLAAVGLCDRYLLVCDKSCFVQRQISKAVCCSLRLALTMIIITLVLHSNAVDYFELAAGAVPMVHFLCCLKIRISVFKQKDQYYIQLLRQC